MNRRLFMAGIILFPLTGKVKTDEYAHVDIDCHSIRKRDTEKLNDALDFLHELSLKLYYEMNTKQQLLPDAIGEKLQYNIQNALHKEGIMWCPDTRDVTYARSMHFRLRGDYLRIKVYPNLKVEIKRGYKL